MFFSGHMSKQVDLRLELKKSTSKDGSACKMPSDLQREIKKNNFLSHFINSALLFSAGICLL